MQCLAPFPDADAGGRSGGGTCHRAEESSSPDCEAGFVVVDKPEAAAEAAEDVAKDEPEEVAPETAEVAEEAADDEQLPAVAEPQVKDRAGGGGGGVPAPGRNAVSRQHEEEDVPVEDDAAESAEKHHQPEIATTSASVPAADSQKVHHLVHYNQLFVGNSRKVTLVRLGCTVTIF